VPFDRDLAPIKLTQWPTKIIALKQRGDIFFQGFQSRLFVIIVGEYNTPSISAMRCKNAGFLI
jgi:hypothetical protein